MVRMITVVLLFALLITSLSGCQISPIMAPTPVPSINSPVPDYGIITEPQTGSTVEGQVLISGSAKVDSFQQYQLFYKLASMPDEAMTYFAGDTKPVESGLLAIWNTDGLAPGKYDLIMRVVKNNGNYAELYVRGVNVK